MDLNVYVVEILAKQRLAELRAMAATHAVRRAATAAGPLRVAAGRALQRLGTWMAGPAVLDEPRPEPR